MAALGQMRPLSSLAGEWRLSAKSGHFDPVILVDAAGIEPETRNPKPNP
jgi:hypothetical protein